MRQSLCKQGLGAHIFFAYAPFKWSNLAAKNAGITVVIVGLSSQPPKSANLFNVENDGTLSIRAVPNINGYLIPGPAIYVGKRSEPLADVSVMSFGNHPYYAAELFMSLAEARELTARNPEIVKFLRPIYGSTEVIKGVPRQCLWIEDSLLGEAKKIPELKERLDSVRAARKKKTADSTAQVLADAPHRFRDTQAAKRSFIAVPQTTSENREYLPCDLMDARALVTFKCYALYDAPLWNLAIVASKLHIAWIGAVCGRLEMRYSYSNTLGWNTFPVPVLTEKNKADLTRCAEDILLAREAHFPATIADLYDTENTPANVREAHNRNDEVFERIYIGRRFRNDTERLEKLFDLYTKMTTAQGTARKRNAGART